MKMTKTIFPALFCGLILFCGCALKESLYSPTVAEQKFLTLVKNEFKYDVKIKSVGKTFWIFLPGERELFKYKASQESAGSGAAKKLSILYLDGNFSDQTFNLEYDIIPATKAKVSDGLSGDYTEAYNEEYRNIFSSVARVFLEASQPPVFIVLVFADIKNGIEITNTLNLDDLKKYQAGALPQDEYTLRVLSDSKGDPKITGDSEARHLAFTDISWPDFLTRQIIHRVNFKYQNSDFPPSENSVNEILKIVAATTGNYNFTGFSSVRLKDLRSAKDYIFDRTQLKNFPN